MFQFLTELVYKISKKFIEIKSQFNPTPEQEIKNKLHDLGTVFKKNEITFPSIEGFENAKKMPQNDGAEYSEYYQQLFPQDTIRIAYVELDPGVDDGAAVLQLLARLANQENATKGKKIEILGMVPCVGNAVLSQTEVNTLQFLTLTGNQNIPAFPGAIAPLAIENNQTAIEEMEAGINATHFYGHDGESDVGGWPKINMNMQATPGYQFVANLVANASHDAPITLVSTASLTELAKTLMELENLDQLNGRQAGSFAKNIAAISIMGGIIDPKNGANAPFNWPDKEKISEANFYFDVSACEIVMGICQKYQISILLLPLDLTQQPGLLWTKAEVNTLSNMGNPVAQQMARVTDVVPYLDAPCFPNESYPMHDLQSATALLFPEFYNTTRMSITIGDVGQIIVNESAIDTEKNVFVLTMPSEKQPLFYKTVLAEYQNFDCLVSNQCEATNSGWTTAQIATIAASGIAALSLAGLALYGISKHCKRNQQAYTSIEEVQDKASIQDSSDEAGAEKPDTSELTKPILFKGVATSSASEKSKIPALRPEV